MIKGRLLEIKIRNAKEGLQELRGVSGFLSNIWGVRFFVDLNDFNDLLDGRIDLVLTVTGSPQDAFANTAACISAGIGAEEGWIS